MSKATRKSGPLDPRPDIWAELGDGKRLLGVLKDFYSRVFEDERLSPFFEGVTQQRVRDKQYSFMASKLTGDNSYFGDRPRNAHHWMVISNELFDHRENLFALCLREHGLSEGVVNHLREIDEVFRKQIVKSAPRTRKLAGIEMPLDGYNSLELEVAGLCDGCAKEVDVGEIVVYHLRTGVAYCEQCALAKSLTPIDV